MGSKENVQRTADSRPSDVLSYQSSIPDDPGPSRWWAFTRHRPNSPSQSTPLTGHQASRRPLREWERSLSIPWLSRSQQGSPSIPPANPPSSFQKQEEEQSDTIIPADPLHVDIPPPPTTPYTIAQNTTPGWDSPWSARPLGDNPRAFNRSAERVPQLTPVDEHTSEKTKTASTWARRRKRVRAYMLYNPYVPLVRRSDLSPYVCMSSLPAQALPLHQHCFYGSSYGYCHSYPQYGETQWRHGRCGLISVRLDHWLSCGTIVPDAQWTLAHSSLSSPA